jgi:hypothetical protein
MKSPTHPERKEAEMTKDTLTVLPDRRLILTRFLPAGAFACLACRCAFAAVEPAKSKTAAPVEMSYDEMFKTFYLESFIPTMKAMGEEIGRDKLVEMLKRASAKAAEEGVKEWTKTLPNRDLATFTEDMRKPSPLYRHALRYEILEDKPTVFEARVTECLWAKTFRGANAADIGYAYVCYPDTAATKAFNPKFRVTHSGKTLMEGNDRCQSRLVLET